MPARTLPLFAPLVSLGVVVLSLEPGVVVVVACQ